MELVVRFYQQDAYLLLQDVIYWKNSSAMFLSTLRMSFNPIQNFSCQLWNCFKDVLEQAFPKTILINSWLKGEESSGMHIYSTLKTEFT